MKLCTYFIHFIAYLLYLYICLYLYTTYSSVYTHMCAHTISLIAFSLVIVSLLDFSIISWRQECTCWMSPRAPQPQHYQPLGLHHLCCEHPEHREVFGASLVHTHPVPIATLLRWGNRNLLWTHSQGSPGCGDTATPQTHPHTSLYRLPSSSVSAFAPRSASCKLCPHCGVHEGFRHLYPKIRLLCP